MTRRYLLLLGLILTLGGCRTQLPQHSTITGMVERDPLLAEALATWSEHKTQKSLAVIYRRLLSKISRSDSATQEVIESLLGKPGVQSDTAWCYIPDDSTYCVDVYLEKGVVVGCEEM